MNQGLTHRKATIKDLRAIISLLLEDELGKQRERLAEVIDPCYIDAFHCINADPNQYLMMVEDGIQLVATCHLTIRPSLTFMGATRLQIEAVRVAEALRSCGIGEWMMQAAIEYGKESGASIFQLTTNKQRTRAQKFYERLGFEASHEGMIYIFPKG